MCCYDPPPFFSPPSTVTTRPAAPAPAPAPVPAALPACAVMPVACRAPAHTPTHYVYPSLPEALIPVRAIPPSHTAASPTPQLRREPDTMDVDDKSPTPHRQGAEESRTTTPRAQPIPKPVLPRLDTRDCHGWQVSTREGGERGWKEGKRGLRLFLPSVDQKASQRRD